MTNLDAFDYVPSEIIKKTRIIVNEGGALVRQARKDYHLTEPIDDRDGPAMQSWKARDRSARATPSVLNEAMQTAIKFIVDKERAGRAAAAGVALVRLREHYEAYNADELATDEQSWEAFLRKHAPSVSIKRANELAGRAVFCGGLMRCTSCGTKTKCGCGCGAPYEPEHRWAMRVEAATKPRTALDRAIAALVEHPGKTTRAIADEIGVGRQTVSRARQHLADAMKDGTKDGTRDGTNATTGHGAHKATPLPPQAPDRDLIQDEYQDANFGPKTEEERWQWSAANLFGDVIAASAYWQREFGDWQKFQPPKELTSLMEQATDALKTLKPRRKQE